MTLYEPVFFDLETSGLSPIESPWEYVSQSDAQVITIGVGFFREVHPDMDPDELELEIRVFENTGSEYSILKNARQFIRNKVAKLEDWWPYHELEEGQMLKMKEGKGLDTECFLVSWNGRKFDHAYAGARYARLRQDPFPFGYRRKRLDMMKSIRDKTGVVFSQDDWCEEKDIEVNDSVVGSDVPELWENGRTDKIKAHCYSDIEDMMRLFHADWEWHMEHFCDHYGISRKHNAEARWDAERKHS